MTLRPLRLRRRCCLRAAPSDQPPTLEDIDKELAGVRGYQKFLSDIRPKVAAGQKTAVGQLVSQRRGRGQGQSDGQ